MFWLITRTFVHKYVIDMLNKVFAKSVFIYLQDHIVLVLESKSELGNTWFGSTPNIICQKENLFRINSVEIVSEDS